MNSTSKQHKPQVSIESIKQIVKRLKNQGFESLSHHDLAVALSTIGFSEIQTMISVGTGRQTFQDLQIYLYSAQEETLKKQYYSLDQVKQLMSTVNGQSKKDVFSTVDNFKRNALHIAVKQGFDVLAEYLINEGFPLNSRDRQLKTPIHYCRNQLICQVLVNKKAKVIVKDNKMCTPVHYIASGGDYKCLQILLKAANVVNQKDSTGKTALFYAIYNTSQEQVNIIRILLQNGGKVNEQDIYGKTSLHYAAEIGKSRCIPILLRKGASVDARDKHGKTPLDLAEGQQKVKKMILAYCNNHGVIFEQQQEKKRKEFKQIGQQKNQTALKQSNIGKQQKTSKVKTSKIKDSSLQNRTGQSQIYTQQINQVSTWVRQKFFVLMKKLQESGVKAMWHLKRPYVYTGSWAEDIQSLEDLYETFLNVNGPEAAMRAFNILCPYQKPLPTVLSKSEQAFHSFFGESWFSNDPVEKLRNLHSSSKIRNQLQLKMKESQDLKTELMGYRSEIQGLQSKIMNLNQQISHYKKVEDQLRRQKNKNTQQYTQILRLMSENEQLKCERDNLVGGQQKTKILSNLVTDLRSKNQDLQNQIQKMRVIQAAARRKCGQIFLKSLSLAQNSEQFKVPSQQNLYDDDAIISLYNLLKNNPPNLEKRFKNADRRGNNKLGIDQFTQMLEDLSMLPQDVMSMHRITGFAFGRKTLSLQQFKTILQNRHKNRPMWEKKLIRKLKTIILEQDIDLQKFFKLIDKDGNGTIEASQLRKGLQQYNIFMNQSDWSNLFNLLDSDNSGQIDLNELKTLFQQEKTGKLEDYNKKSQQEQNKKQNQIDQPQDHENNENNEEKNDNEENKQEENQEQQNKENQQDNQQKVDENQQNKEQEQQVQPYQQKDSDQQQGTVKLNGKLKIQVPALKVQKQDGSALDKAYVKFYVNDDIDSDDSIKLADLSKKNLQIVSELKFIQYKVSDLENLTLTVSIWASREMDEQNYLGEVFVNLKDIIQKPGQWGVSEKMKLTAEQYEKNVKGKIFLQVKWTPQDE